MNITSAFTSALRYHQCGNFRKAEELYRKIVQQEPRYADAWHLLGVIAYQSGNYDIAIEHIEKAIKINPSSFSYYNNLGNAYYARTDLSKALDCYKKAISMKPDYAEAHNNLGNIFFDMGDTRQALMCYKKAAELRPYFVEAYNNIGNAHKELGDYNEASLHYKKALRLKPDFAEASDNLGQVLAEKGELDEAISFFLKAIQSRPDFADAYNDLGNVLKEKGDIESAALYYKEALLLKPDFAEAYNNFGTIKENLIEAIEFYRKALELKPDFFEAYNNLGNAFKDSGDFEKAEECYQKAAEIKPDYAEAHFSLGILYLLTGNFEAGWKNYEWRFLREDKKLRPTVPRLSQPMWDGSSIEDKTIYIYHEQGFGDTIQFARYLPMLHERGATVLFRPHPELQSLFEINSLKAAIIHSSSSPDLFNFDLHSPLLSLPLLLGTNAGNIPCRSKYIYASVEKVKSFREKYFDTDKLKIGICWRGRPTHKNDRNRSIPLDYFYRLTELSNIRTYSLQKGKAAEQLDNLPKGIEIIDLSKSSTDFSDTAAAIENLDLVITVDTAVAHLAGAMGKPTWILLPYIPDWRWFLNSEDTPWYESVRLFRQTTPGLWNDVLEKVYDSLDSFC